MSGKHVRWADASYGTPSPTWSDTSLPSTEGLITPPSFTIELPNEDDCELHPILLASHNFQIAYDVSLPSSTASIRDPKLSQFGLTQPATTVPLPYIELIVPRLPWKLVIWPAVQGQCVTVADVLAGIYANLRLPVTPKEFEEGGSDAIAAAFRRRCRRGASKETEAIQIAKGVKRIDFLEGRNIFMGLTPTKQPHVFRMDTRD